jgi:lipopolysaccharide export system protein LptC
MPTLKTLATNLVLVLLALGSWWAAEWLAPKEETPEQPPPGKIDYYSKQIRRTVMDEAGRPKELLLADTLIHYENDNHTELTRPVMTLYSKNAKPGPPWVIHADSALLPGEGETIYLQGEVLVERGADKRGKTVRIETSDARAQPDHDYAETDEHVRVLSEGDTMTGDGGQVWFGDYLRFKMLSNARRVSIPKEKETPPAGARSRARR